MFRKILYYGAIAGLIAGGSLSVVTVTMRHSMGGVLGMAVGYLTMLIALSAIFIAIKQYRDVDRGGVVKFLPAFGLGLGISVVAGILYVTAWELTQWLTHMDFANGYARAMIAEQQAKGGQWRRPGQGHRRDGGVQDTVRQSAIPLAHDLYRNLPGRGPGIADLGGSSAQSALPAGTAGAVILTLPFNSVLHCSG